MNKNTWNLEKVKKFLENFAENTSDYYMVVINKETNKEGCAIIRKDKKIVVFEGKNDGSEDKILSQKEFKEKYKIEKINKSVNEVTVEDIEMEFCSLDTEYREALAYSLVELKYISDTPLKLKYGTEKQQNELKRFWEKPLKSQQIDSIIRNITMKMRGDYQYGRFMCIASKYLKIAEEMKKSEKSNVKRAVEAR